MPTWILIFIFSKFLPFIFFEQICSQNLKFHKKNEISYRGTLLYAYYDFDVYLFKILFFKLFWANLVAKSNFFQID